MKSTKASLLYDIHLLPWNRMKYFKLSYCFQSLSLNLCYSLEGRNLCFQTCARRMRRNLRVKPKR
jgi:hypothetical protein